MTKTILPYILIILLASCISTTAPIDYLGQPYPDETPVIFAPEVVSVKGRFEHGISFTPDGREMAFGILNNEDYNGAMYYAKKVGDDWARPEVFKPLAGKSVYLPYFTPDGKSLLYAQSTSDANYNRTDIWKLEKHSDDWGSPKKLDAPINSTSRQANASMTLDGTLYFSSNVNCEGKENCYDADLFYARLENDTYKTAQEIPALLSDNDEESIFIAPEEDYLIFCTYTDNEFGMDLYISYRNAKQLWTAPQRLDTTINTADWERRPFVSIDNQLLFFTRLRLGQIDIKESDIYWVDTSSLFKPYVYNAPSDITLHVGEPFEVALPADYFKDINDTQLTISSNHEALDWLEFDSKQMKLSGVPTKAGVFEFIVTAVDAVSNETADTIRLTVEK